MRHGPSSSWLSIFLFLASFGRIPGKSGPRAGNPLLKVPERGYGQCRAGHRWKRPTSAETENGHHGHGPASHETIILSQERLFLPWQAPLRPSIPEATLRRSAV